ncbi:hypothetical protein DFP73DRAFT_613634 [Morchella snyderi]|nr:hypothetical protein DFP73DRAFT_613634 [Morchella snyderi]
MDPPPKRNRMHKNAEGEGTVTEVVNTEVEATGVNGGARGAIPASDTGIPAGRARSPGGGEPSAPVPAAGTSELPISRGGELRHLFQTPKIRKSSLNNHFYQLIAELVSIRKGERAVPEMVSTGMEATGSSFPGGGEASAPVSVAGASERPIARGGAKGDQVYIEGESYEKGDVGNKGSGAESGRQVLGYELTRAFLTPMTNYYLDAANYLTLSSISEASSHRPSKNWITSAIASAITATC